MALMFTSATFAQHDQYGKWKWTNDDRGFIWLKSNSTNPNGTKPAGPMYYPTTLMISYAKDDPKEQCLYFVLENDASPIIVDSMYGDAIVEMELSFDNGENGHFKFRYNNHYMDKSYKVYQFVITDRFRRTFAYYATSLLKQMKNKNTLTLTYKVSNGSTRTQVFNLEGLEALLEILYE